MLAGVGNQETAQLPVEARGGVSGLGEVLQEMKTMSITESIQADDDALRASSGALDSQCR